MSDDRLETVEPLTLEQFERLPEEDEFLLELVRGRVVREPRPGGRHGRVTMRIAWLVESFARERELGWTLVDTGFLLSDDPPTVRGPDVAFLTRENLPATGAPTGFWRRPPDLAVEVVSPSNAAVEIQNKVLEYLAAGTRLVWVVDPATESATAYRSRDEIRVLTGGDVLDGDDVLPGFRLELARLFTESTGHTGINTV